MNLHTPNADTESRVQAALAQMVFARSRVATLIGLPLSVLICWLLWSFLPAQLLLGWLAAKCCTSGARIWVAERFRADDPAQAPYWKRRFEWTLAADGAVFGLLGTLLVPPEDPALAASLITMLVAIAGMAMVILVMSQRTLLAMVLPMIVPAALYQFTLGTRMSVYTGIGLCVFLLLVMQEGRRAAQHTQDMLRIRYQIDDLAEQRQQALDLAERNAAVKDRFLAIMSHELRTPLHGTLGLARMLDAARESQDQHSWHRHLQMLNKTSEHLLSVINDVLDYSKIDAGHLSLNPRSFDLAAALDSAVAVGRATASERRLDMLLQSSLPRPTWVLGDATRLQQILLNLIGNAVKFTTRGGITLRCERRASGETVIDVSDTGEGIPPNRIEAIFNPFEQLDSSDGRRHGGTGLGLTISRELARAMGGDLACVASSEAGSTFRLSLSLPDSAPLADLHDPLARVPEWPAARVLLVEDNPVNALVAGATLDKLGLRYVQADDGEQALQQVMAPGAQAFDLILMDCQMPGMDGFEATRRIRDHELQQALRRCPIVALTASAQPGDRQRSLQAGMDDHLAKPFTEDELVATLRRHLPAEG